MVPHMYLYNSDNCHYDLMVEEKRRLVILGLITIKEEEVEKLRSYHDLMSHRREVHP